MLRGDLVADYPSIDSPASPLKWSQQITSFYKVITTKKEQWCVAFLRPILLISLHRSHVAEAVVLSVASACITLQDLECMPIGLSLPLREALRACRLYSL